MKKCIFAIITIIILISLVFIIASYRNDIIIKQLIVKSIESQYNDEKVNLGQLYTKEFIEKVKNDKTFYKENLRPYKIINIYTIEKNIKKGDYSFGVRISDKNGEYIQIMHVKKINNSFLIFDIEYDI